MSTPAATSQTNSKRKDTDPPSSTSTRRRGEKSRSPTPPGGGITRVDHVVDLLRSDIINARFAPNERLRFPDLVATYSVGVGTLREALSRLVGDGLVKLTNQRGFRVSPSSRSDLLDIIDIQKLLEVQALRRSIAAGDDEWEGDVVSTFHRMILVEERRNNGRFEELAEEWESAHNSFHAALYQGCDSHWLLQFASILRTQAVRYRHLANVRQQQHPELTVHHEPIVKAALERDAETACMLLSEHFDQSTRIVLTSLEARGVHEITGYDDDI